MTEVRLCSRPVIGLLSAAGAALVVAFVPAPAVLLDGALRPEPGLRDELGRGLAEYWQSGGPAFPALLARLVDYWFRWHAIKVVTSSLMLVVFVLLATVLWRRYLHGMARRAVAAAGATVAAVLATGLLILNIQATAVPLIALLPLLSGGPPEAEIARTLRSAGPDGGPPALPVLLGAVERYYWVLVAAAGAVLVSTALASVLLWKRRGAGSRRAGSMRKTLSVIFALTAVLLVVVVAASVVAAIEPTGALLVALGAN